ncbi:MAG: TrkA C-terminal domain-containing protein [Halioglobus sp.]|nr:TrkA C-terminal domain-containing protein [Halioglobus sp.]
MLETDLFLSFLDVLRNQPVLGLFLIIGIGYLVGGIKLGSFSLGPVAGVLFAGLFLGHFDFRMSPGAQAVGFALFIFSVGYQAGPRFFDVLRTDGLRYFLLAVVIAVCGFTIAVVASKFLALDPGTSAGILSGGLTSSPTLAAAQEAIRSGQVQPPPGFTADEMMNNLATGYAITYIFGLAGLIAIIKLLPRLLGIDLVAEAAALESAEKDALTPENAHVDARVYRIANPDITALTIAELRETYWDERSIVHIRRNGNILKHGDTDQVELGDELLVVGPVEFFTTSISKIAEEITPDINRDEATQTAQVVVINRDVVGKTLRQLQLPHQFGVIITRLSRTNMSVPLGADVEISKGDILTVVGTNENIDVFGDEIGHVERPIAETDMVTFSFGIVAGVLLGLAAITFGNVSIGLGSAGGLLASGLIIGYYRSVYPVFGRIPDGALWILMEFGLLLFMAGVGLRAGGDIIATFVSAGPALIIAGACVTVIPVLIGYVFGRKVLKIHPVLLLGGITGSMTSGASLSVVTSEAKSPMPSLGYTGAYAFANVLLTIAGSLILYF